MLRRQQTVLGFLPDLLGRAAGHGQAFAGRAGQRRALGIACDACSSLCRVIATSRSHAGRGTGAHLAQPRTSQQPARGDAAQAHGRQRLAHGGSDQTRVLDRGLGLVPQAVSLLELALCVLGGVGVPFIDGFLGLLRPETEGAALVLQKLADPAAGRDVGQTDHGLRHSDGALDGGSGNIARPAAEAAGNGFVVLTP